MRIELDHGSIKRVVNVWRDSDPLPGEKPVRRIKVDEYQSGLPPSTVASVALRETPRLRQFHLSPGREADKPLAALEKGPIKVKPTATGDIVVDLDRPERP